MKCTYCLEKFRALHTNQIFCSASCRMKEYRLMKDCPLNRTERNLVRMRAAGWDWEFIMKELNVGNMIYVGNPWKFIRTAMITSDDCEIIAAGLAEGWISVDEIRLLRDYQAAKD